VRARPWQHVCVSKDVSVATSCLPPACPSLPCSSPEAHSMRLDKHAASHFLTTFMFGEALLQGGQN
jgi:hypothetical protein